MWYRWNGSNNIVQTASYNNGFWSGLQNLSAAGQDAHSPQIDINNNSQAIAVWQREDGGTHQTVIQAKIYSGGVWSGTTTDLSDSSYNASFAQIALNNNNNAIAIWKRYDGTKYDIESSSYRNNSWSSVAILSSPSNHNAAVPQVALNDSERGSAVWYKWNGANEIIQTSSYNNGSWTTSEDLSSPGQDARFPQVAINSSSKLVVVWHRSDGLNSIIQSIIGYLVIYPPQNLTLSQKKNIFPTQTERYNLLRWRSSTTPFTSFRIYRGNVLIKEVPCSINKFVDRFQVKHTDVVYSISAVRFGIESTKIIVETYL